MRRNYHTIDHCIEKLKNDLTQYEEKCGLNSSVLDSLFNIYQEANPVDDGLIRQREAAITPVFQELSVPASDVLTGLIVDLVTAYQRAAFGEGIHIGFHLSEELQSKSAPQI